MSAALHMSTTLQKALEAAHNALISRDRMGFVVAVRVVQSIVKEPHTVRLLESAIMQFPHLEASCILREVTDSQMPVSR